MITNLEGLLERILLLSSCAGCVVWELLASILVLLSISEGDLSRDAVLQILENSQADAFRTTAVIWRWVVERKDVSVGETRRYNDAPLSEILCLAKRSSVTEPAASTRPSDTSTAEEDELRVYVSEDTMWESLTGHGVDHKRIPRSEWILLQGIASTATKGILQGDLGRLVGQDKRSVPKRTSCLVEKGYITKRTTLVRGTKTSKLWLKFLAPSTSDESNEGREAENDVTLSRQILVENLEPVPWHTRWTGDSIDYKVLATTIMAICKEWNVMRLQDLKSKLCVLGMTWQMKVVSKICRFLNARGTIQYVAAKLNSRIFKDCIRFRREMNARDWSIFLATGKRTAKLSKNAAQEYVEDDASMIGIFKGTRGFGPSHSPSWCIYTPITSLVALFIQESGFDGLTNPQLCAMTIGPSFTRYLAGLTASISTDNIQPSNVMHLSVKSERGRPGKSSSLYYYSMTSSEAHEDGTQRSIHRSVPNAEGYCCSSSESYSFTGLAHRSCIPSRSLTLSDLCQRGLSQQKRRGRPRKIKLEQRPTSPDPTSQELTLAHDPATRGIRRTIIQSMVLEGDVELGDQRVETEHDRETSGMRDLMEPVDMKALEERTTRARGRPRIPDAGQAGRKSLASRSQAANGRQFKCEKCAGTWKNDVGLKYHLEKSQTHCNPSFKPHLISSSKASGFALIKRHALQTTRPTRKNNNTHADDLFADGKSSCVQPIGEKQTNFKGKGVLGLAVSSIRKKHHQKVELAKINEDISILSGQAKLLTAVSVSSPRQVDPFAKPAVRQFAARRHSKSMPEDPEASKSCGRPQQVVFEASEAHPVVSALTPPDSALPAEHVKEPPEKLRIKNPVRHVLMNIITELLYRHSGTLPTGEPLVSLVYEKWKSKHREGDAPSPARIKSTMLQMIREKKIVDQWHAFRAPDGRIGKCQIITIPSVPAFAPETKTLVEKIRQIYPANILPHQMPGHPYKPQSLETAIEEEEESDLVRTHQHDSKPGGRGRRSLAAGVAVLSAPVYAAQIAMKRAVETGELPSFPGKRRRTTEEVTQALEVSQNQQFWPVTDLCPPSSNIQQLPPSTSPGFTMDILFDKDTKSGHGVTRIATPLWDRNSLTHCFERLAGSMQREGWIEESSGFSWATHYRMPTQSPFKAHADRLQSDYFVEKLKLCLDIETEVEYNVQLPTRAHNVFINFHGGDTGIHLQMPMLQWHKPNRRQSITADAAIKADDNAVGSSSVSAVDNEPEPETATLQRSYFLNSDPPRQRTPTSLKRLTLASRILTPLAPEAHEHRLAVERRSDVDDNEIVAAFVVIRSLLGGIDRTIDWGLLAHLFPTIGLQYLRRFWARLRKEQASFMAKATQEFQDSLILAIQADEIAIPNYERPLDYDWMRLIQWAIKHPNQEHLQLPSSRERFNHEFTCKSGIDNSEDWKEKFFHPQSSVYARFEAATLHSGSLTTTEITQILRSEPALSTVDVARSWIRSLCCTSETEYTPQDVKERFSMLSQDTQQRNTAVLKTAIDQLTRERVICKSKRTPFGGRPYRLNESYASVLSKVSHRQKYLDAVAFKESLDKAFQGAGAMRVPYTLSDGAMMALMNLIASERIRIAAAAVPNIPFGFEPGNYESRKYPKSYYHMDLEIQPTHTYLFNDDIDIIRLVRQVGPPREGRTREIPQWIDFFGKLDKQRWADILGAVCFAFNTRGIVSVAGMCEAVAPILDVFEAQLIVSWGLETGLFVRGKEYFDIGLGEWWWLVAQRP
ncbi:TFIIIC transcription initiation factor complex subunits Tfc3 [Cordyceps javanica]|uniref:TFIIIC transcription initiation factor complex subunits Tfc3 n=1 Tax=Cordyceps javanica TaxID=43265 RepID=A0A545VBK8_9HYPO|nr:TFIIIC transcription initiation factor complex subunits Tfc3 [Cordyceps javanica]